LHRLLHTALERCLVVEIGRCIPGQAEEAQFVKQGRRDPGVLIDIEVNQVRDDIDNRRAPAGSCGGAAVFDRNLLTGLRVQSLQIVGRDIVGIEIADPQNPPNEHPVENDQADNQQTNHTAQDEPFAAVPAGRINEGQ